MKGNDFIKRLSPYLFWDVDLNNVDAEKNEPFIVQRVLEYGQLSDWNIVYSHYGLDRIINTAKNLRSLDPNIAALLLRKPIGNRFQMLHYETIDPATLKLLKSLQGINRNRFYAISNTPKTSAFFHAPARIAFLFGNCPLAQ